VVDWIEAPRKVLGAEGGRYFSLPRLVVGVVVAGRVEPPVEGLHEAVELRTETILECLEVALLLPPLSSAIFKPNLRQYLQVGSMKLTIFTCTYGTIKLTIYTGMYNKVNNIYRYVQ